MFKDSESIEEKNLPDEIAGFFNEKVLKLLKDTTQSMMQCSMATG